MENRRVYEEVRMLVEERNGTMKFEREGYQWGAWIVRIGDKEKIFLSNGSGFPELDNLYETKPDVLQPSHWSDYTNTLVNGAWNKLAQLLEEK